MDTILSHPIHRGKAGTTSPKYFIANQARCRAPRRPGGGGEEAEAAVRREKVGSSVGAKEGARREGGGRGEGGHAAVALAGVTSNWLLRCIHVGCCSKWGVICVTIYSLQRWRKLCQYLI